MFRRRYVPRLFDFQLRLGYSVEQSVVLLEPVHNLIAHRPDRIRHRVGELAHFFGHLLRLLAKAVDGV